MATAVKSPVNGKKLPYIIDIRPHLVVGDVAPIFTFMEVLQRWNKKGHPHWIVDAAFGSTGMMNDVDTTGGYATMSTAVSNQPWLWKVLSYNLPPGHWRAAIQSSTGYIASCHALTDDKGQKHYQQLLASGWNSVEQEESEATQEVATISSMPLFTREELMKLKVAKLREICKLYNIKQGKRKEGFVDNIFQRSESVHHHSHQVDAIYRSISSNFIKDPAPLHNFYKEWFNLVDLADKRWYSVEETHAHQRWETKMIIAILRLAVLDCWVYVTKSRYQKWKSWRISLLKELIVIN